MATKRMNSNKRKKSTGRAAIPARNALKDPRDVVVTTDERRSIHAASIVCAHARSDASFVAYIVEDLLRRGFQVITVDGRRVKPPPMADVASLLVPRGREPSAA
jgi:hypothetical protein